MPGDRGCLSIADFEKLFRASGHRLPTQETGEFDANHTSRGGCNVLGRKIIENLMLGNHSSGRFLDRGRRSGLRAGWQLFTCGHAAIVSSLNRWMVGVAQRVAAVG